GQRSLQLRSAETGRPAAAPDVARGGDRRPRPGSGSEARARGPAGADADGGDPGRRRGVLLQGGRADPGDQDRDRDVAASSRPSSSAETALGLRRAAASQDGWSDTMSSDCDAAMDRLSVYLDRELTERDMEEVRAHLDD